MLLLPAATFSCSRPRGFHEPKPSGSPIQPKSLRNWQPGCEDGELQETAPRLRDCRESLRTDPPQRVERRGLAFLACQLVQQDHDAGKAPFRPARRFPNQKKGCIPSCGQQVRLTAESSGCFPGSLAPPAKIALALVQRRGCEQCEHPGCRYSLLARPGTGPTGITGGLCFVR